jgi:hypothetical protein
VCVVWIRPSGGIKMGPDEVARNLWVVCGGEVREVFCRDRSD